MLRPGYPGGVPYPPRPGEQSALRYIIPGALGAPPPPPPAQSPYSGRDGVYGRPPEDSRSGAAERSAARMRQPPYPLYHQDYRDGVQVLSVAGRPVNDGVHVVGGVPPSSLASLHQQQQQDSKRQRLAEPHNLPQLRIDTREAAKEPGYHPQVEAISPTPDDRTQERDDVKSTKDDLLQKISKVDREIAKAESQIAKLKKKQTDLEDAANKPSTDSSSDDAVPNQSLAQMVYSENRRKAEESHAALDKFSAKNELPLYNQPSDTDMYSYNKKSYTVFKKKLVEYFKKTQAEREQKDKSLLVTYCKLSGRWNKKTDRIENSRKRKEREAKCREMYEKMFPELRKQREDKERDARLGTRGIVKSDADFEDVIERLQEQEMEDKKMHSYAVIPPLLLPEVERKRTFTNTNGLIPDPLVIYNDRKYVNMWTEAERETFKEKYLQHPKNFGMIAQYLERKSVADCVQYYYISKKTENYKQLLRKSRVRGNRGNRNRQQAPPAEIIGPSIPRVVTRGKAREELLPKDETNNGGKGSRAGTPNNVKNDENGDSGNDKETGKKKPERGRDSKKTTENQNDSSDEDDSNHAVKSGPHPCVSCKQIVETSRAVSKSQAGQLGLCEDDVGEEGRVCNKCWCQTLKKKHICQVPSCTSSKRPNRGKLRHLPSKWYDLEARSKDIIMKELQLPENIKRVCTACFTRITRRISQPDVAGDSSKKKEEENVTWTEAEIEEAKLSLRSHGTDWSKMSESIKTKTYDQCKKFYDGQRKRLQLDKLVAEYKKSRSDKPSLTSDEESGSSTSSCEEEQTEAGETKPEPASSTKPASGAGGGQGETSGGKTEPEKKEAEYDSAATVSADEGGDSNSKGRAGSAVSKNISYHDLIGAVISRSVHTPGNPVSTSASTSASPSIGDLLNQAPPVPPGVKRNSAGVPTTTAATVSAGKEPSPAPPAGRPTASTSTASDVLDLTLTKPGRESPAVGAAHIEQFSYPGISRPPPEPVPESKGLEPPPAHGGAHSKTTHQDIMNQETTLFRKDNKSPAPSIHSPTPGLWPRTVTDPRKELKSSTSQSAPPPLAAKRPGESRGGSIVAGTPHRAAPPQHSPRTSYEQSKAGLGSITTGHPLYQPKPGSVRGPPQAGAVRAGEPARSGQPQAEQAAAYRNIYRGGGQGRQGNSESSPSGMVGASSSRDIISTDFKIAQTLKNQPREAAYPRHSDPHGRREDPRPEMRGHPKDVFPVHYEPRSSVRGDPRDQIPVRGDPREMFRDPRAMIDARGRPGPGYIDPRMQQQVRPRSPHRSLASGHPSHPPGLTSSQASARGSITQGVPKQPREVEMFRGHPEVSITKQSQPGPSSSLADLADVAASQQRISQRPPEPRFDPRARGEPSLGGARHPGQEDIERQRAMVMSFNQMSEAEQRQYINALTAGGYRPGSAENNMTASTLIEAIITHQINRNTGAPGQPPSRHSPQAGGDGKESPNKIPSRSPSVKSFTEREGLEVGGGGGGGSGATIRTSPGTMGEHIENMINKEVIRQPTSSPYPGPGPSTVTESHEHWKRRGYPEHLPRPPSNSHLVADERQILRVSQAGPEPPLSSPRVSPPTSSFLPGQGGDSAMARYFAAARRKDAEAAAARPGFGLNDDYLKNRISEMMKNEKAGGGGAGAAAASLAASDLVAKSLSMTMGPPIKRPLETEARGSPAEPTAGGSGGPESPRKKYKPDEGGAPGPSNDLPDSPESGNMVIDETARPDSAHSHKTSSPAPSSYPGNYPGNPAPPVSRPPPANPRYEPLSDDD